MGLVVRILGPVVIDRADAPCGSLSPTLRLIVAVLAAHRRAVVSIDRLCDVVWGDVQPTAAVATLQSHLSRARRLLAPEGAIVALDRGYRLDLPDGCLDVDHFGRLSRQASDASEPATAAALYRSALEWWRGPAFGELADQEWIRAEAVRLDELRQTITEEFIECRLAIGGDTSLVGDLEGLTTTHPLRERFVRQLMVALFREGRQAEALRRASTFRGLLRDEIGLDPSPALLAVEGQILADDPAVLGVARVPSRSRWLGTVADDPTRLVGRDDDIGRIADAVAQSQLVTLVGPGGVGKTRLARRVAATAQDFDDGVAFVELAAVSDGDAPSPPRSTCNRASVSRSRTRSWRRSANVTSSSSSTTASIFSMRSCRSWTASAPAARACTCWRRRASRSGCRVRLSPSCHR
jgi:DNA-binding SARP family transcriptional activator